MTTFINYIIYRFLSSSNFGALTDGIAVIVAAILLILLIEKVLLDAYEGKSIENKTEAFTIITVPLLFVMSVIVFLRIAQILH